MYVICKVMFFIGYIFKNIHNFSITAIFLIIHTTVQCSNFCCFKFTLKKCTCIIVNRLNMHLIFYCKLFSDLGAAKTIPFINFITSRVEQKGA